MASSAKGSLAITRMPRPSSRQRVARPTAPQADEAGGAAGELPAAEALVGDRAVAVHLALAHVAVGGHEVAGDGEQQADGQLGHAVGVAARAPGAPGCPWRWRRRRRRWWGRRGSSRWPRAGRSSTGPAHWSASQMRTVAPELGGPLGELLARRRGGAAGGRSTGRGRPRRAPRGRRPPGPRSGAVEKMTGRSVTRAVLASMGGGGYEPLGPAGRRRPGRTGRCGRRAASRAHRRRRAAKDRERGRQVGDRRRGADEERRQRRRAPARPSGSPTPGRAARRARRRTRAPRSARPGS